MDDVNHEIWACSSELHGISELLAHVGDDFATDQTAMNGLGLVLERISKRLMALHVHLDQPNQRQKRSFK